MAVSPADLEAAWLSTTGDSLPALLASAGGPWQVIQAYAARTPATRQTSIFVMPDRLRSTRLAFQRRIRQYPLKLECWWPIGSSTAASSLTLWEDEARNLDAALALLVTRVEGLVGDHSHGGRFLSGAELDSDIEVQFADPRQTATQSPAMLRADVTYRVDGFDYTA